MEHINYLFTQHSDKAIRLRQSILCAPLSISEFPGAQELILALTHMEQGLLLTQLQKQATQPTPTNEATSHLKKITEL